MKDILRGVVLTGIFIVPFLPLVVANSYFFPFITGKNFAFRVVVEVIFASWVVLALMDAKYRPRFSWVLGAFVWFVGIMLAADLSGVAAHKSLWSNFERMEGFVALAHLFLYFLVIGSTLTTEKLWRSFFATSLSVASLMSLYAFGQLGGMFQINQSDTRVDARMGNSAYLAIYMLFHIYIALLLLVRTKTRNMQIGLAVLAVTFLYVLLQTGTRGAALAFIGSALLTAGYIALFERENPLLRKIAIGGIAAVIALSGLAVALKDTEFVRSSPNLSRITSISFSEGSTRFTIWALAVEGIKERPLLGWGQENFNYVFNKYYKASLYAQEPWFDRVHNIALDWLIAGGILGFLAYSFLIASTLFYATVRPLYAKYSDTFSVTERGLILGVIAGYIAHNLFVFDNLISYTLFTAIIAMVHSRVAEEIPAIASIKIEDSILKNIVAPTIGIIALGSLYMINVPGMSVAKDLIKGFQATTPDAQYAAFDTAYSRDSFADQEITEQFTRIAQQTIQTPGASEDVKKRFGERAEAELVRQLQETPNDVRILVFLSSYYRVVGKPTEAIAALEQAIVLSPEKQQIHFELGLALIQQGRIAEALDRFKIAYELEPKNEQARMFYAAAAIYAGDDALLDTLITDEFERPYAESEAILRAYYDTKRFGDLAEFLNKRIEYAPQDPQNRVSLAAIQREAGDTKAAILTLRKAGEDIPTFKAQADQYIAQLEADTTPKQ